MIKHKQIYNPEKVTITPYQRKGDGETTCHWQNVCPNASGNTNDGWFAQSHQEDRPKRIKGHGIELKSLPHMA